MARRRAGPQRSTTASILRHPFQAVKGQQWVSRFVPSQEWASCEPDEARGSPQPEAYSLYVEGCGRPSNEVWRRKLAQHACWWPAAALASAHPTASRTTSSRTDEGGKHDEHTLSASGPDGRSPRSRG